LAAYAANALSPNTYHPVGTCAKMPLELGSVVCEDFRVHGIQGHSIVDASIMPLLIGATTQHIVYAVVEKVSKLYFQNFLSSWAWML
jgi:choline dehydrogenase